MTPGSPAFAVAPDVPELPELELNGRAQTLNAEMPVWAVQDATGTGAGWNVSVQGDGTAGRAAVFTGFCADGNPDSGWDDIDSATAGAQPGPGYIAVNPKTLAPNSLTLNSTGALFEPAYGSTGTAPTHSCSAGCNLDSPSPVIIGSAAAGAGMGTWVAHTYDGSSLTLSAPTTVEAVGTGNKGYVVNLLHTLASGPG